MIVVFKLLLFISSASGAKILGVVLTASYSHQIVFAPLWRELSLRGHQVTTITTHPINDPQLVNLTEIDVGFVLKDADEFIQKIINQAQGNIVSQLESFFSITAAVTDLQLDYGPVKKLINDPEARFDLVILEYLWATPLAFAHRFNCPFIGMLSIDAVNIVYQRLGSPSHSSLYPDHILGYGDELTLFQRVVSFLFDIAFNSYTVGALFKHEDLIVAKHFGNDYPPLLEISTNVSMVFVNSDPIFHHNRPLVPAVVQIGGGSHMTPVKPLPQELQDVLDKAEDGFIYFSLGSNVKSEFLSLKIINTMMETFAELPYTILWKFEENISNKPSNVITSKWLPQQDVLRHPNIKLFITQGGLQSTDEAIYSHVPMIGMPFFGDQFYNVKKMVNKGYGLEIDYRSLEKGHFKQTILEVIGNPRYRNTITELAKLAQDQPMTGLEKAVWWTEYVIRHKGEKHLRSPLLDIPWYQYLLLDVIAVLVLSLSLVTFLIVFGVKLIIRFAKRKLFTVKKEKIL